VRIDVQAGGYDTAAEALYAANHAAAIAYDGLRDKLSGFHALGGDDTSSEDFVAAYDPSAQAAVDALRSLVTGLGGVGDVAAASGRNHRAANAASVYRRSHPTYDGGDPGRGPVEVAAFTPPTALGGDNEDVPDWWNHVVDHLQGFGWPSANTDQLRDAAAAWRTAAGAVEGLTDRIDIAIGHLEQQRSPEIPTALDVLSTTKTNITDLAAALRQQGDCCEDYASQVDQTRDTIRGLLKDLAIECGVTAGIGIIGSFVTFGGAGAVSAGVIAARAVRYARLILAALRGLKAARAAARLATAASRITRLKNAFERLKQAQQMVKAFQLAKKGTLVERGALNAKQAKNYNRFLKKFAKGLDEPEIRRLPDGTTAYTSTVPGRVPGSYAEYTKIVDEAGNTVQMVKTTYAPDGKIVHIKDKF
jgi:hypothetical protein